MSCCTLGRRKVWVSLPKSPPYSYVILSRTFGQRKWMEVLPERVVLHPRATKSVGFVAEESLHPYVILSYTHRQQKWKEVSPERVVLHPRATKRRGSVAQVCRTAPSGDENARQCCPSVSCCTLGRRKVWVSLPKSPFILTSSCPTPTGNKNGRKCRLNMSCRTLGQRKCATVLPKRAALHPRATKMGVGVAQACRAALSGDE